MNNMKSVITMMNAMKYYKHEELFHEREGMEEKLSQDMNHPAFHKLVAKIREKFFLNRG